jgi:HEAT repeat protein
MIGKPDAINRPLFLKKENRKKGFFTETLKTDSTKHHSEGRSMYGTGRDPVQEAERRHEERHEQNISILIRQLSDQNPNLRARSAESLGNMGDPRAVEPLLLLIDDPVSDVVWVALRSLGTLRDPRAFEPLIRCIDNPDRWIRQGAAWALGELGDPRAGSVIIPLLVDKKKGVRQSAAEALGKIGDIRYQEYLEPLLKDDDLEVRHAAREALKKLK